MNQQTVNAPELPRNEMAFRQIYHHLLASRKLTAVVRPGERGSSDWRGYDSGDVVTARVLEKVGADWAGISPVFLSESYQIKIEKVQILRLRDLVADHFIGTSDDVRDRRSLIYHLGTIYNLPIASFGKDSKITHISFSYI